MSPQTILSDLKSAKPTFPVHDGVSLRAISVDDVTQDYVDGLNDPDVRQHLGASKASRQTYDSVAAYVEANDKSDDAVLLGIFVSGRLCGTVRIHDIDFDANSAVMGIALFDKGVWGKGIGQAALREACHVGQARLGLCELSAIIKPTNEASKKIFSKTGFCQDDRDEELWVLRGTD